MSEGTSLEDIEKGYITNEADQQAMQAIMADMNAAEPEIPPQSPMQMPPMMPQMQMPPMMPQMQMPPMMPQMYSMQMEEKEPFTASYEPMEVPAPKKNEWSTLFDQFRDALVVGLLVCFFSLPALHTWLGKRCSWMYKVGGEMSWIGFLLLFISSALIYTVYQSIVKKIGL